MLTEVKKTLNPFAAGLTTTMINHLYEMITGQTGPTSHGAAERDAQARLRAFLETGDANIVMDLRKLNGTDDKCFDLFWEVAEGKIEELVQPQVRRACKCLCNFCWCTAEQHDSSSIHNQLPNRPMRVVTEAARRPSPSMCGTCTSSAWRLS